MDGTKFSLVNSLLDLEISLLSDQIFELRGLKKSVDKILVCRGVSV